MFYASCAGPPRPAHSSLLALAPPGQARPPVLLSHWPKDPSATALAPVYRASCPCAPSFLRDAARPGPAPSELGARCGFVPGRCSGTYPAAASASRRASQETPRRAPRAPCRPGRGRRDPPPPGSHCCRRRGQRGPRGGGCGGSGRGALSRRAEGGEDAGPRGGEGEPGTGAASALPTRLPCGPLPLCPRPVLRGSPGWATPPRLPGGLGLGHLGR